MATYTHIRNELWSLSIYVYTYIHTYTQCDRHDCTYQYLNTSVHTCVQTTAYMCAWCLSVCRSRCACIHLCVCSVCVSANSLICWTPFGSWRHRVWNAQLIVFGIYISIYKFMYIYHCCCQPPHTTRTHMAPRGVQQNACTQDTGHNTCDLLAALSALEAL